MASTSLVAVEAPGTRSAAPAEAQGDAERRRLGGDVHPGEHVRQSQQADAAITAITAPASISTRRGDVEDECSLAPPSDVAGDGRQRQEAEQAADEGDVHVCAVAVRTAATATPQMIADTTPSRAIARSTVDAGEDRPHEAQHRGQRRAGRARSP